MLGGWPLLRHVLFPLSAPALWTGALVTFVLALNNFGVPALLQTKVYPAEVWVSFNTNFSYTQALGLSWPLVLGPLALIWYFHRRPVKLAFKSAGVKSRLLRERLGVWFWARPWLQRLRFAFRSCCRSASLSWTREPGMSSSRPSKQASEPCSTPFCLRRDRL